MEKTTLCITGDQAAGPVPAELLGLQAGDTLAVHFGQHSQGGGPPQPCVELSIERAAAPPSE